jgi:hypothetical protein
MGSSVWQGKPAGSRVIGFPSHIGTQSFEFKLTYRSNDTAHQASAATIAAAGIVMTQA